VAAISKLSSNVAYPPLLTRLTKIGFSKTDLKTTLTYIRDVAPIIIHFNLNKLELFLKSDRYKN